MKKTTLFFIYILATVLAFFLGLYMQRRTVNPERMEKCLELYYDYRKNLDQTALAAKLSEINLTPEDFQKIIDKFIYYRSKKSGLNQAMKLLNAFRSGYKFEVQKVEEITGMTNEPFRLDAEILSVFEKNPDLVDKAFEG